MKAVQYKKRKWGYFALSYGLLILTLLSYILYGYIAHLTGSEPDSLVKEIMSRLVPYTLVAVGLVVACILISNKLRTTAWMATTIIGTLLFSKWGLIITFVLWIIDEYWLHRKYEKMKLRQEMAIVRDEEKDDGEERNAG